MSRPGMDIGNAAPPVSPEGATLTALSQASPTNPPFESTLEPPLEADMQLTWPDSEDLLQTILSSDLSSWTMPLDILPFPQYSPVNAPNAQPSLGFNDSQDPSVDGGSQAVRHLSQMITSLVSHYETMLNQYMASLLAIFQSADVTAEVESTGITSVFLDGCMHMFFTQFIPSFPVLHRATFVFRDCTHPVLLNAIAIGSLFMSPRDTVAKVTWLPGFLACRQLTVFRERHFGALHTQLLLLPYVRLLALPW
jgi:hypothetical protein